jgi:hypothetical protein
MRMNHVQQLGLSATPVDQQSPAVACAGLGCSWTVPRRAVIHARDAHTTRRHIPGGISSNCGSPSSIVTQGAFEAT